MVVNSVNFFFFFIIVFLVYYLPIFKNTNNFQNIWIFIASCVFYGIADLKMIPILLFAITLFYYLGRWLKNEMGKNHTAIASRITTFSVFLGIGFLLYFKYLNFFADSFAHLLNAIGFEITWTTLNIVLPIGVSFFTFKLISYIIEIYREHIEPCISFVDFAVYISFFPTILSGPIDRPDRFLPQIRSRRIFNFSQSLDGFRQILWGIFIKMCIADNISEATNSVWSSSSDFTGSTLLITSFFYYIQLYADFDGYSNMAIGVGKLLGIRVTRNFNHPLLARNVAEYWRRWHMSLTSWITDYIFMPLNIAFRNYGNYGVVFAIMINLIVIGMWHGANWTYVLFGMYHGLLFIPLIVSGAFGKKKKLKYSSFGLPIKSDFFKMILTSILVSFGLIIFRADNIADVFSYINGIFSSSIISLPELHVRRVVLLFILILLLLEWYQRDKEYPFQLESNNINVIKWTQYVLDYLIIASIIFFGNFESNHFIYFQF